MRFEYDCSVQKEGYKVKDEFSSHAKCDDNKTNSFQYGIGRSYDPASKGLAAPGYFVATGDSLIT